MSTDDRPGSGPSVTWPTIVAADVPEPLVTAHFVLEPLEPKHNARDHEAWMSSIAHIRATPGFGPTDWGGDEWPIPMSLDQNLGDLHMHADEFRRGEAYAYSVLDRPDGDVIGCVYIDPDDLGLADAKVRSWVRDSHAHLDDELAAAVAAWLASSWPFSSVRYVGRF
jgi:hypothetical protein